MRNSYLTVALVAAGLLVAAPVFAQSTTSTTANPGNGKQTTQQAKKQHTDGADVTNTPAYPPASGSYAAQKQRTDGEDVTGNNNFAPASK